MTVTRRPGGQVSIALENEEALDLADFLNQFYEDTGSAPDNLSSLLDVVLDVERED